MTALMWIGIVAAGVILGVVILGCLVSPPFELRAKRTIPHPPERVWEALHDKQAVPMAGKQCRGIEDVPAANGLPAWREDMGPSTALIETLESDRPARVVRRFTDSVVPMTMTCTYTITPTTDGCALAVEGQGRIDRGTWHVPLFRVLIKLLGMGRKGQVNYLDAVARRAAA